MYCWLLLQIYLCYLWLLLCSRDTYLSIIIFIVIVLGVNGPLCWHILGNLWLLFCVNTTHATELMSREAFFKVTLLLTIKTHLWSAQLLRFSPVQRQMLICLANSLSKSEIRVSKSFRLSRHVNGASKSSAKSSTYKPSGDVHTSLFFGSSMSSSSLSLPATSS